MASTSKTPSPAPDGDDGIREFRIGDATYANVFAPADFQGRRGHVTEIGPGASEYRVEFEDNRLPTTGYLMAWWMEALPRA